MCGLRDERFIGLVGAAGVGEFEVALAPGSAGDGGASGLGGEVPDCPGVEERG